MTQITFQTAQLLNLSTQHSFPSTITIFKTYFLWNNSRLQLSQLLIADVKTKIKALKTKTNKNSPISYTFQAVTLIIPRTGASHLKPAVKATWSVNTHACESTSRFLIATHVGEMGALRMDEQYASLESLLK